jgi:2-polyprenyl-6-methoxyphenol hydroxylase-like FAD-dependent oxidoreductase
VGEPLDVLICGAGPAGCATALALRQQGVAHVAVVDWPLERPWAVGESATPDVGAMLARLGLPGLLQGHAPCQGTLSFWGGRREVNDFLHRGQGPGWHLDRSTFDAQLRQATVDAGVPLWRPARVDQLTWQPQAGAPCGGIWQVRLNDQRLVQARVLVDASGRRAELATRLGAQRHRLDSLVALGMRLWLPRADLGGLSLIEPFEHGWWYAAPLPDGHTVICLMADQEIAQRHGWRDPDRFVHAWRDTQALAQSLPPPAPADAMRASPGEGRPADPWQVASFAAHSACLDRAAGPGWMAVGDALMSLDPLTSSGISGSLHDALCAAATVSGWLQGEPMAPGGQAWARRADTTWRRYLDQRHTHYAAEPRWPLSPFWATRRQPPHAPPFPPLTLKEPHHGTLQGLRLQGAP